MPAREMFPAMGVSQRLIKLETDAWFGHDGIVSANRKVRRVEIPTARSKFFQDFFSQHLRSAGFVDGNAPGQSVVRASIVIARLGGGAIRRQRPDGCRAIDSFPAKV